MVKAAFGGGGRGMRVVEKPKDLMTRLEEAQREARAAFGNDAVFLERYIRRARHLEVQILGDHHGNVIHLHERDCTVQRRHQKVIEVAPAVGLDRAVAARFAEAAVSIAREVNYYSAGTVEFLMDMDTGDWYFIEVNPRIQVEHTITEEVTGVDIVRCQIQVAQGKNLHGEEMNLPHGEPVPLNGYRIAVPRHHRRSGAEFRARLRAAAYLPLAGRLRHPSGWRLGLRRGRDYAVL